MAAQAKQYLDLTGLQTYDTLIKNWANSPNQFGYKKIIASADNNYLYFYKDASATISSTPDATVSLGSGDLSGKIAAMATTLDFTYDSQTGTYSFIVPEGIPEDTLVGCIHHIWGYARELYQRYPVTVEETNGSTGSDILKSYTFYQGITGRESAAQKEAKKITTVNIPKDYVVKSATVETVETADVPYAGAEVGDKYIDFVINTKDGSGSGTAQHIYIPFKDLMHPISGSTGTEVTVAVDSNNQISASINTIASSKITYIGETLEDILSTLESDDTVTGSIRNTAKTYAQNAVGALDTSTDVAIASVSGDTITLQNGVKQEDGLIAQGTGDGITISPIGTTSINSLFSAS